MTATAALELTMTLEDAVAEDDKAVVHHVRVAKDTVGLMRRSVWSHRPVLASRLPVVPHLSPGGA